MKCTGTDHIFVAPVPKKSSVARRSCEQASEALQRALAISAA